MIKIIDKRTGKVDSGNILSHLQTFATYDPQGLPYSAQHWWHEIEIDTGFIVIISDDDMRRFHQEGIREVVDWMWNGHSEIHHVPEAGGECLCIYLDDWEDKLKEWGIKRTGDGRLWRV